MPVRRPILAILLGLAALLAVPAIVLADGPGVGPGVAGGCTVTGTSTSGGTVDLTQAGVWHVRSTDTVEISGAAPTAQDEVVANVVVLGYAIPLVSETGSGTGGSRQFAVADFARYGRVFVIQGSSSGTGEACTGQIQVIIDDLSPVTTALGAAAAALTLVGALIGLLALRRPGRFAGRLSAVLGFGLAASGASVLVQQFSDGLATVPESAFVLSIPGLTGITTDPVVLAQAAVATAVLVIVLPFPAELFNKTVEEHLDEIRGWVAGFPVVGMLARGEADRWQGAGPIAAFVALSALLYGLLSPGFGADLRGLVTWGGTAVALVVAAWTAAVPKRTIQQAVNGDRGRLRAVFGTLGVAVACVAISRWTGFLPGYLYGLLFGYAFVRELVATDEGRGVHAGAWWMALVAAAAWLLLDATRVAGVAGTIPGELLSSVLATLVVGGIEGIVFGLLPMRFLAGAPLFAWNRIRWGILYAIGLIGFLVIILNPANGFTATANPAALPTAIGLFIGFGLLSFGTWAYFRYRKPPASV